MAGNGQKSDALRTWPGLGAQPTVAGKAKSLELLSSTSSVDCTRLTKTVHNMRMGVPLYYAPYCVYIFKHVWRLQSIQGAAVVMQSWMEVQLSTLTSARRNGSIIMTMRQRSRQPGARWASLDDKFRMA